MRSSLYMTRAVPIGDLAACFAVVVALFLSTPAVFGQGPEGESANQEEQSVFTESVDVRLINLEIIVEKRGERVAGLTPADFILRVDGEPVPIEFFSEVREGESARGGAEGPVPTNYLLFIDDVFSLPELRSELLDELAADLEALRSVDRMAIISYGGHSVDILQPWTSSKEQLVSALEAAKERDSRGWKNFWKSYDGPEKNKQVSYEFERLIDSASSAVRSLDRPDGRKVLVMLAGSWPAFSRRWVGEAAVAGLDAPRSPLDAPLGTLYWKSLVDAANLVGYTVYTVDVPGRRRAWSGKEEEESEHERNLRWLAERTGGLGMTRSWAERALARIVEDGDSYYSLAFEPTWQANDQRREVDIELVGVDAQVRARDSFTDLSRQTETSLTVEAAHLFERPIDDAEQLRVSMGEIERKGWRKALLPLEIEIPLDHLTHLPTRGGYAARLELRVAATDDEGSRSDIPVVPIALEFPAKPPAGATAIYETSLHVRKRDQNLLISLVDVVSGAHLSTRLELDP